MWFEGHFTDGRVALRRPVRILLAANRLQIFDEGDRLLEEWPLAGLRLAEKVSPGGPVRLAHRDRGEARLILATHEILGPLGRALPQLRRGFLSRRRALAPLALGGLGLIVLLAALVWAVPLLAGPLVGLVPAKWEEAVGAQIIDAFGRKYGRCRGEAGQAVLEALARRLGAAGQRPFRSRVHVFPSPHVNAFAAPAGHIGLFQGLIHSAATPEEVAGVLAHEMGHAAKRHPTAGLLRALGFWLILSSLVGESSGPASSAAGIGETLLNLSFSRKDEEEADRAGMEMLNGAGIRSDGLLAFFRRLQKSGKDDPGALAFLSSHPALEKRIAAIRALARQGGKAMTDQEWRAVKRICEAPA